MLRKIQSNPSPEKMSEEPVEGIHSSETKSADSVKILKEALKRIELDIENETTDGDKFGRTLTYHEAHMKKCGESDEFLRVFKQLPMEDQIAWAAEKYDTICKFLPKSLVTLLPGVFYCGVAPRSFDQIPDWVDMEKFRKGQEFIKDNYAMVWIGMLHGINLIYFFEDGVKPLIMNGKLTTPYTAFKRYLSTIRRMDEIYFGEPWTEGSPAQQEVKNIRKQHLAMWNKLQKHDNKTLQEASTLKNPHAPSYEFIKQDLQATCPIPAEGQCPFDWWTNSAPKRAKSLNQTEMSMIQFTFIAFVVWKPELLGIHDATDESLEAFCHTWKGIGYLLGIENEFNFCNGTLKEIKQRIEDAIEYWIKPNLRNYNKDGEHLLRSLYEGSTYNYGIMNYDVAFLLTSDAIGLNMTNLYASLSYLDWIYYNVIKFFTRRLLALAPVKKMINMYMINAKNRGLSFDAKKHAELKEKSLKSMIDPSVIKPIPMT